ncbi:MAG: hypothetical protein KF773_38845 [Deltaproteobacteria bacterium]|nr:hypothetical protein [Deltaproteobacteria bacterium]MCW5804295.1 hypothetical protein [Deltaproteobacteria bacterium]
MRGIVLAAVLCSCGGMDLHATVSFDDAVGDVKVNGITATSPIVIEEHFSSPAEGRSWLFELEVHLDSTSQSLAVSATCPHDSNTEGASVEESTYVIKRSVPVGAYLTGRGRCDDTTWDF